MVASMTNDGISTPLAMLGDQRSHVLFGQSHANPRREAALLHWHPGAFRQAVSNVARALSVLRYEKHEADVTEGLFAPVALS